MSGTAQGATARSDQPHCQIASTARVMADLPGERRQPPGHALRPLANSSPSECHTRENSAA